MADSGELLLQLKEYAHCNDELAMRIRRTVLEPFQMDLSRPETIKPPPTPARFKQMASQLAPIAMRIVNQNMESLVGVKRATLTTGNYVTAVNCLVDTSFYALTALRHMNNFTTLKPLDIEKTTSNLLGKMVDLGEHIRVLDEIRKFRSILGSAAKVQLDSKATIGNKTKTLIQKGVLTEAQPNHQSIHKRSFSPVPETFIKNQWEEEMVSKYHDLFQFPFDKTINDRTMVLLVLAYQMNLIRSWCELGDGALAKFIPYFMEKPGNFIEWCKHLNTIDSETSKKQLDSLQRLLYKAANKYPLIEEAAFHCYNLQTVALNTIKLSGASPLKPVMDRMVRIAITYEKASTQTSYSSIQQRCKEFFQDLNPNVDNRIEMDSYFLLCEYYVYVSQKAKSNEGVFYAYKYMLEPLIHLIETPSQCSFYHAAYVTNAKLALASLRMDKMVSDSTFVDMNTTFKEIIVCLSTVSTTLEKSPAQDDHTEKALYSLCKSIDGFRQSGKRLYEFISEKAKLALNETKNDPFKTPPRIEELATPSDFGPWTTNMTQLNAALQACSEILPSSLCLTKKKASSTNKRTASQTDIMISFIDIMVLLARMNFNISDDNTHHQAYEYLSSAEDMCKQVNFSAGYRWLSGSYYNLGATMIKTELFTSAMYPLRKSCTLLEKDTERINTTEGRLQLCKRYEILGTCCQKNERYEDAIKAYRFALKRAPLSILEKFTSRADTTAVSTIIETDPLIPKLIDRFLRASIIDPSQSGIQFASQSMDLFTLTPIQQCIIYECELKVWNFLSLKLNVSKFQMMIIEKLLGIYTEEEYPIRRARVLLDQFRVQRGKYCDKERNTHIALAIANDVIALLNVQSYGKDTDLLNYRCHYLALASSWVAICSRELNDKVSNTFSTTLQQWRILLKQITPIYNSGGSSKEEIELVYKSVDDIEQFYDHVRMLVDLFGVTGQHIYQIRALRILLKLNNGLRDINADCISDSIILSTMIGKLYLELGYTGKAAIEFKNAKNAISSRKCSNNAQLIYNINYANYLARMGDYETSKKLFDATKALWQQTPNVESKNSYLTAKAYTARCMLLADVYITKSLISENTDTLDSAIDCSMAALQLLNKCIKVAQRANEDRSEKQKKVPDELENPFMPPPKPSDQDEAEKVVFRESQWVMAQKIGTCLNTMASLYMRKGSWSEVSYFIKQGPLLAEKVNSDMMLYYSCLCSSEFNRRFGKLTESKEDLEQALEYQPTGQNHILDEIYLKLSLGNLAVASKYYNEALVTFEGIEKMIHSLLDSAYIFNIEHQIGRDVSKDTRVMFDDEVESSDKYDYIPLQLLLSSVIIQKALVFSLKGSVKKGLELLEKLDESKIINQNETELNAAIATLKLSLVRQELSHRPDAKMLLYESMSLPEMKVTLPEGAVVTTTKNLLRSIAEDFTNSVDRMVCAYRTGYIRERPAIIEGICKQSAFTMFLQKHIAKSSNAFAKNYALDSAYYFEMAKGLSLRRDMQNCLKKKLDKSLAGQAPSDNKWPVSISDQEEHQFSHVSVDYGWLEEHLNSISNLYREEKDLDGKDFQEKFVNILPVNWTVCSLTLDPIHQDLYAVQMRTNEVPFVVKIPFNRSVHRMNAHGVITYEEAVSEFQEIISGSDDTIQNSNNCNNPSQVEAWWNKRKDLDERLKNLLHSIENQWFGGFKGVLSGRNLENLDELYKFQKKLNIFSCNMVCSTSYKKKQIELDINFCRMMLCLGDKPTFRELEDLAFFIFSCYEANDIKIDYSKIDIRKMTDQIKILIKGYHERSLKSGVNTFKKIQNDHVILILDKHLQQFPLECTPILLQQSVSRLPCLSFLRDRILYTKAHETRDAYEDFGAIETVWKDLSVSRKSAFYVLNPSGDLQDTQKEFEPLFKSIPEWDGITQTMPMELQCKEALRSRDIYMYFGHSAGQAFMRGSTVKQLPKCAVSLLMGCSSGVLESNGEFDPHGYILNYLIAGSPAVVANLWDVTDRSIDKLTKHMLLKWGMLRRNGPVSNPKSLVQAVSESRPQGKLTYLIGAATVVYGIPVYIN